MAAPVPHPPPTPSALLRPPGQLWKQLTFLVSIHSKIGTEKKPHKARTA